MRRILVGLIIVSVLAFAGCAGKTADAGPSAAASISPSASAATSADVSPTFDLTDKAALFDYVKSNISEITQEDFATWEVFYHNITGEGPDEAVLVSTYGANWHQQLVVLSTDSGNVTQIPCDANAGKYGTFVDYADGFLSVLVANGGTGESFTDMLLYVYDGSQMVNVLRELRVESQVGAQDADYTTTGEIEGDLTDFTYTLIKQDNITGKTTVLQKTQYTYNADAKVFDEKPLQTDSAQTTQSSSGSAVSFKVSKGSLIVTYGDVTRTFEGGMVYDILKEGEVLQEKLHVLDAYQEGNRIYFTVQAPDYSDGEVQYYFDVTTGFIHWFGSDVNDSEEGEGVRLTGFTNETVRGNAINYSDYSAVIVPMYPSEGLNSGALSVMPFIDNPDGYGLDFAVFGTLESVTIIRYDNGAVGDQWSIGDLTDTIVSIHSNLQSDMSYYEISGTIHVGEGLFENVSFTLDDMRDASEYDIVLIW